MSRKTTALTDELYEYLVEVSVRETDVLRRLREETAELENARMQISPEQGQFMALLVELTGAKKALELGTFTGYSTLCVASAMPDDGRVIACDIDKEWPSFGMRYWAEAGVSHGTTTYHFASRDAIVTITYAVVVFSILVQGLTMGRLIRSASPA